MPRARKRPFPISVFAGEAIEYVGPPPRTGEGQQNGLRWLLPGRLAPVIRSGLLWGIATLLWGIATLLRRVPWLLREARL